MPLTLIKSPEVCNRPLVHGRDRVGKSSALAVFDVAQRLEEELDA
jgi:hypothetical protein